MSSSDRDTDPRPELTRRMAEAWRAQRPTELDVARARRRFALRAGLRERARARPLAWVVAIVFGAGSVLAAGGLVVRPWLAAQGEVAPQSSERAPRPVVRPDRAPLGASVSERGEALQLAFPEVVVAPPVALAEAPARAASAPREEKVAAAAERTASGAWARAAAALRQGDSEAAQRALGEVMATGSKPERDAAALLEAQLWVQSGRGEQAAPRLRELAESGATSTIRRQAGELLNTQPSNAQP